MASVQKSKSGAKVKKSLGDQIVDIIIYIVLGLVALSTVLPFLYVLAGSFATDKELTEKAFFIIPEVWSLNAYKYAINTANILKGLRNSIILTVMGTVMCMIFSLTFAYPLSKPHFRGRNWIMNMVIVTMLFSGGMIPSYIVYRNLGLLNTIWVLIIPGLIDTYWLIIMRNYIMGIPESISEAARIDGSGEFRLMTTIILPLCGPILATLVLVYSVAHWNAYTNAVMFITKNELMPLQVVVRNLYNSGVSAELDDGTRPPTETVRAAAVMLVTLPVIVAYPFLQKYFVQGVKSGAVKG